MTQVRSEIIINILRRHFPRASDSKLTKVAEKLQRKWRINGQAREMPSTREGETIMPTKLLFLDDNIDLVKTATRYMNEIRPQWKFLLAHTLAEAREIYNMHAPDAAVLDVQLPDGSGLDLLSEFKRQRPELPVIVISGDDPETISQAVIERGGYAFLPKPFSTPVLVSHIESAITAFRHEAAYQAELQGENGWAWKNPHALALRLDSQNEASEPEDVISKRLFLK